MTSVQSGESFMQIKKMAKFWSVYLILVVSIGMQRNDNCYWQEYNVKINYQDSLIWN